jgi:hypothetical protein
MIDPGDNLLTGLLLACSRVAGQFFSRQLTPVGLGEGPGCAGLFLWQAGAWGHRRPAQPSEPAGMHLFRGCGH